MFIVSILCESTNTINKSVYLSLLLLSLFLSLSLFAIFVASSLSLSLFAIFVASSLSLSVSLCLSLSLSVYLSVSLYLCLSVSISLSPSQSIYLSSQTSTDSLTPSLFYSTLNFQSNNFICSLILKRILKYKNKNYKRYQFLYKPF